MSNFGPKFPKNEPREYYAIQRPLHNYEAQDANAEIKIPSFGREELETLSKLRDSDLFSLDDEEVLKSILKSVNDFAAALLDRKDVHDFIKLYSTSETVQETLLSIGLVSLDRFEQHYGKENLRSGMVDRPVLQNEFLEDMFVKEIELDDGRKLDISFAGAETIFREKRRDGWNLSLIPNFKFKFSDSDEEIYLGFDINPEETNLFLNDVKIVNHQGQFYFHPIRPEDSFIKTLSPFYSYDENKGLRDD